MNYHNYSNPQKPIWFLNNPPGFLKKNPNKPISICVYYTDTYVITYKLVHKCEMRVLQ